MTLTELVTNLRYMLEDLGGHNTDWTLTANAHLLKWTNDELVLFINEAEKEVARRTHILFDSTNPEICEVDVVANESSFPLHEKILRIRRAKLASKSKPLVDVSWRDLEAISANWDSNTGTPVYYVLDWDSGFVKLSPVPTVDDTLLLSVYRLPLVPMRWLYRDTDKPEIPEEYHHSMLYWAAHMAYDKDEPNTLDPQRSAYFVQKFASEFGPKEDAYSQERKKRTKRAVAYGGIR